MVFAECLAWGCSLAALKDCGLSAVTAGAARAHIAYKLQQVGIGCLSAALLPCSLRVAA